MSEHVHPIEQTIIIHNNDYYKLWAYYPNTRIKTGLACFSEANGMRTHLTSNHHPDRVVNPQPSQLRVPSPNPQSQTKSVVLTIGPSPSPSNPGYYISFAVRAESSPCSTSNHPCTPLFFFGPLALFFPDLRSTSPRKWKSLATRIFLHYMEFALPLNRLKSA